MLCMDCPPPCTVPTPSTGALTPETPTQACREPPGSAHQGLALNYLGAGKGGVWFCAVQFNQSCPALCDPMDGSTPGFPVHHQLLELAQTPVHHPTISSSVMLCFKENSVSFFIVITSM